MLHSGPSLWLPWTAGHPRPAGDPGSYSWCGKQCCDGSVEVAVGNWDPPLPRLCWWPSRSPAGVATGGQSMPGEPPPVSCQRQPAAGAWAAGAWAAPEILRWSDTSGRFRHPLPAPARKDCMSWVIVLCMVVDAAAVPLALDPGHVILQTGLYAQYWELVAGAWCSAVNHPSTATAGWMPPQTLETWLLLVLPGLLPTSLWATWSSHVSETTPLWLMRPWSPLMMRKWQIFLPILQYPWPSSARSGSWLTVSNPQSHPWLVVWSGTVHPYVSSTCMAVVGRLAWL